MKPPLQTPQTDPVLLSSDPIVQSNDPIIFDVSGHLSLLDQSARLTIRLWESVAIVPLRFSQKRRLERILARLTKVTTQPTKVATS
jgi:hypothetical protein